MEYYLKLGEETNNGGIKRIAIEQLEKACENLKDTEDQHEGVHNARKNLKKSRGLLKLISADLGKETYQKENTALRNAGRSLGEIRDISTHIEALDYFLKHEQVLSETEKHALHDIRKQLLSKKEEINKRLLEQSDRPEAVAAQIEEVKNRVSGWPDLHQDFSAFYEGLKSTYKSGRNAMKKAIKKQSEKNLHEWRKRSKDLWYQLRLLQQVWPSVMQVWCKELDHLTDMMGEEHDLAVLEAQIRNNNLEFDSEVQRDSILKKLTKNREQIQKNIFPTGSKIFEEKPSHFVKRIEHYWHISYEYLIEA